MKKVTPLLVYSNRRLHFSSSLRKTGGWAMVFAAYVISSLAMAQQLSLDDMVEKLRVLQEQIVEAEEKAESDPRVQEKFKLAQQKNMEHLEFCQRFEPLLEAEREMYAANSNLAAVLDERVNVYPAAVEQLKLITLSEDRRRALTFDMALGKLRLNHPDSVFARMVENDPNFSAVAKGEVPPLIENKAQRDWMMNTPLETVKRLMILEIPEAKELHQQLKAWTNELQTVESDLAKAQGEMWQIKSNMRNGDDPESFKAFQRRTTALDQVSKARNLPEYKRSEKAMRDAKRSALDYISDVAAETPEVAALIGQRDRLQAAIMAERRRMSRASGPQPDDVKPPVGSPSPLPAPETPVPSPR